MIDPRVNKLAQVLVHYSLKLKKGKLLQIKGEVTAMPLMLACYEEALKVGAHPYMQFLSIEAEEMFYRLASDDQLNYISPMVKLEYDKMDAMISLWGTQNTRHLNGVAPQKIAARRKAGKALFQKFFKREADGTLKWVGTQFPTHADAQQAEMSLHDYEDFVYNAGCINLKDPVKHWEQVAREQARLVKILNRFDRLHLRAADTDLKLRVRGRKWISCAGTENFPDGEIFTGPIEDSVEGCVSFTYPSTYGGRTVEGVRIELKKGKVVRESASKGEDYLKAMLNMDKGARFIGEFAIGTNYQIQRATGNTLFDEKIGGSFHMAMGASIPESGGKNQSSLHWDIVCDLKKGGEIEADGKIIYRNGKFTI
jgi:aminopeptidase